MKLAPGKIPPDLLDKLLKKFQSPSSKLLVGPGVGLDAAVVKVSDSRLAVTSDPITLAEDLMGYYCVHVNANDLAVMGAEPEFMTVVLLLPVGVDSAAVKRLSDGLARCADQLGVIVVGGHSEITPAVNTSVMVGTMMGRLLARKPIGSAGAKPGDVIVMTKHAALEATAIIARQHPDRLRKTGFTAKDIRRAQNMIFKPGISILPEARIAIQAGCSAMHDATEGGIVSALWEMAVGGKVRIGVDTPAIPLLDVTRRACKVWNIDPLWAISSGSLLASIGPRKAKRLISSLADSGIPASVIGHVARGRPSIMDTSTGRSLSPMQDEILKIFE